MLLLDKSVTDIFTRDHASISPPEQCVPVSRKQIVEIVAYRSWENFQDSSQIPKTGQVSRNFKCCVGSLIALAVLYQQKCIDTHHLYSVRLNQFLSDFTLHRSKYEFFRSIPLDDEIDGADTEIAYPIKDYDVPMSRCILEIGHVFASKLTVLPSTTVISSVANPDTVISAISTKALPFF